jgi:hypothetical protein
MFICPSSCYTMRYLSNQQEYPLFGNETYSGVSLDLKILFEISSENFKEFIDMQSSFT